MFGLHLWSVSCHLRRVPLSQVPTRWVVGLDMVDLGEEDEEEFSKQWKPTKGVDMVVVVEEAIVVGVRVVMVTDSVPDSMCLFASKSECLK